MILYQNISKRNSYRIFSPMTGKAIMIKRKIFINEVSEVFNVEIKKLNNNEEIVEDMRKEHRNYIKGANDA